MPTTMPAIFVRRRVPASVNEAARVERGRRVDEAGCGGAIALVVLAGAAAAGASADGVTAGAPDGASPAVVLAEMDGVSGSGRAIRR